MKKITIVIMIMFGLISFTHAQHEQGQLNANIGVGLGSRIGVGDMGLPPLSLSLDYGINDNISIGGYLGYISTKQDFAGVYSWNWTYMIVGVRGAYHLEVSDNFDPYGGVLLGYNMVSVKTEGSGGKNPVAASSIAYAGFIGARYHFSKGFGVFGELGYGITWLNLGLALKF